MEPAIENVCLSTGSKSNPLSKSLRRSPQPAQNRIRHILRKPRRQVRRHGRDGLWHRADQFFDHVPRLPAQADAAVAWINARSTAASSSGRASMRVISAGASSSGSYCTAPTQSRPTAASRSKASQLAVLNCCCTRRRIASLSGSKSSKQGVDLFFPYHRTDRGIGHLLCMEVIGKYSQFK